jgi:hypothetical protein
MRADEPVTHTHHQFTRTDGPSRMRLMMVGDIAARTDAATPSGWHRAPDRRVQWKCIDRSIVAGEGVTVVTIVGSDD